MLKFTAHCKLVISRPNRHFSNFPIFQFSWDEVEDDCTFILTHYFNDLAFLPVAITKHEYYAQRALIVDLFGYQL